ncbi:uncharacterized protein PFLUO_LOCUS7424 [Penicillium psychrofluorescens]|uniref:uncharacterized protein n=1 Tax=Penicillium psychrofluorescens TaxID=3158075 RepID=UPI003CCDD00B
MPRIVPKGGKVLADQWFPEGSTVGINSWVAHRNQEVYGQDADEFRPERWLEDGSHKKELEAYFFAFGQGSRTCIGKNISLLEVSKGIPQLIRHFDFTFAGDEELVCQNHWFVKPVNFYCTVTKRKT